MPLYDFPLRAVRAQSAIIQNAGIDLGDQLESLCLDLASFAALTGRTELFCETQAGCLVAAEAMGAIARIVKEVATNAVKHAHPSGIPGRIDLACYREGDFIIAEVSDNGVGLPENFDTRRDGGLGFQLVRHLADQLGAALVFESDMLGLRFLLLLPA